jgi:hypothetical protein
MKPLPRVSPAVEEVPTGDVGTRIGIDPVPPTIPVQGQRQVKSRSAVKLNAARRLAKDK